MAKCINSVVTKAGTITRTTTGKAYSHAIVAANGVGVITWTGRPDLAAAEVRKNPGSVAVPVVILDKQPKDPRPEIKVFRAKWTAELSQRWGYVIVDADGTEYVKYGEFEPASNYAVVEKGDEITGYLDRIYITYQFSEYKASR